MIIWMLIACMSTIATSDPVQPSALDETIHSAAMKGDVQVIARKLDADPTLIGALDTGGRQPLHCAMLAPGDEACRLLLDRGAPPNVVDRERRTPLLVAAAALRPDLCKLLLARRADVNAKDKRGSSALLLAITGGGASRGDSARRSEVVSMLLDAGAAASVGDLDGMQPIHAAAWKGRIELVPLLRKHGASVDARNGIDRTPLHHAALGGYSKMIEALIDAGSKPDARDRRGESALHAAARRARIQAIKALLAKGASARLKNAEGQTALHLLADQGPTAVELDAALALAAEPLLDAGIDVNDRDNRGRTALSAAIEQGHKKLAGVLRTRGGRP